MENKENEIELQKISYEFGLIDNIGLSYRSCGEELLLDDELELPTLLNAFNKFLSTCGYGFIDEIVAITKNGEEISSIF